MEDLDFVVVTMQRRLSPNPPMQNRIPTGLRRSWPQDPMAIVASPIACTTVTLEVGLKHGQTVHKCQAWY